MKALFGETRQYSAALSHDLFGVKDGSSVWYGGSQNLYQTQREKTCGCGIAGAADIVLYIDAINRIKAEGHRKVGNETKVTDPGIQIDITAFLAESAILRKKYIPIIPGRGVNAFLLAYGLNRYFKKHGMKYRSRWKWTFIKKWKIVERMLKDDIPVILSIGNNFPIIWGKHELNLYVKDTASTTEHETVYKKQQSVNGHFVVITAIEGNCLTVSSWGKKFYISIDEFDDYVKKHSTHIYSNILEIKKK